MTRTIAVIAIALTFCPTAKAQSSIERVLGEVERNNTTIRALRQSADAERMSNGMGLTPANPEVELGYFWGKPSPVGNKTTLGVSQSFDFPTAYLYRGQLASSRNSKVELEYQSGLRAIRLRVCEICVDLAYHNALQAEYGRRLRHATGIASSYKKRYEVGDVSILDYNKAQVHALNAAKELESNAIEQKLLLAELAGLNGGQPIGFADTLFASTPVNPDFAQWYAQAEQQNPALAALRQEVEVSEREIRLSRALSLPRFSAGYAGEKLTDENFRGVVLGLSIPLWESRNTVKHAKLKLAASRLAEADGRQRYYNHLAMLHQQALSLQAGVDSYREQLGNFSSVGLLQKALAKGEISLVEYLYELAFYYDSFDKLLGMERTLNRVIAEMTHGQ